MNVRNMRRSSLVVFFLAAIVGVLVGLFIEPSTWKEQLKKRLGDLKDIDWDEIEAKIRGR